MKKLQNSGHDEKYRREILISGLNGYRKQLEASAKGITPLYRPRNFQMKERSEKKLDAPMNWFKVGGNFDSVMMIPTTPWSRLKNMLEKNLADNPLGRRIRMVEKPGQKWIDILKMLVKKPKKEKCGDPTCMVNSTEKGGNCMVNEILYKMIWYAFGQIVMGYGRSLAPGSDSIAIETE